MGFSAFGKHPKSAFPVMVRVSLASLYNILQMKANPALLTALFGAMLSPIAGRCGFPAGVLAGMLHMFLVGSLSFLHAGMNLYNNGLSGGFAAAALFPLLEALRGMREARNNKPKPL